MSRALGATEARFLRHDRRTPTTFGVVVHLSQDRDEAWMAARLDELGRCHATLRARVVDGPAPRFVVGTEHGIAWARVPREDDEHWSRVAKDALELPPGGRPGGAMWVVWLASEGPSELLFFFDHAYCDARSALRLIASFLDDEAPSSPAGQVHSVLPALPLALDARLPRRFRGARGKLAAVGLLLRGLLASWGRRGEAGVARDAKLGVVRVRFTADATLRLRSRTRFEGLTLHAVLCSAVLHVVAEERGPHEQKLCLHSLVDLSSRLDPAVGPAEVGLFVSSLLSSHRVHRGMDGRSLARAIAGMLRTSLERGDPLAFLRMVEGTDESESPWTAPLARRLAPSVTVTNFGDLDSLAPSLARHAEDVTCLVAPWKDTEFHVCAYSAHGELSCLLHYAKGQVSDAAALGVARRFAARVASTIGEPCDCSVEQLQLT